jgi:hypothetical protein
VTSKEGYQSLSYVLIAGALRVKAVYAKRTAPLVGGNQAEVIIGISHSPLACMPGRFYDYDFVRGALPAYWGKELAVSLHAQTSKNVIRVLRNSLQTVIQNRLVKMSEANTTDSNYLHSPIYTPCQRLRPNVFANALKHCPITLEPRPIILEPRPSNSPVQSKAENPMALSKEPIAVSFL